MACQSDVPAVLTVTEITGTRPHNGGPRKAPITSRGHPPAAPHSLGAEGSHLLRAAWRGSGLELGPLCPPAKFRDSKIRTRGWVDGDGGVGVLADGRRF